MSFLLKLYSQFVLGLVQRSAWGRLFSSGEKCRAENGMLANVCVIIIWGWQL